MKQKVSIKLSGLFDVTLSRGPLVPLKPGPLAVTPAAPGVGGGLSFRVPKDFPHSRFSKAPLAVYPPKGVRSKPCVSLPVVSLEKIPGLHKTASPIRLPPSSSSSNTSTSSSSSTPSSSSRLKPPLPQRPGEKLSNGHSSTSSSSTPVPPAPRPSPARSPLGRRPSSAPSPSPTRSPSLNRRPAASPSLAHNRTPVAPAVLTAAAASGAASSGATVTSSPTPVDRKQQNGTKAAAAATKTHSIVLCFVMCCRFGSRPVGRGHFVFDRRWDRMRRALHTAVERHLSTHMWRKVPLAAETPLSHRTPASPSPDPHPRPYPPFHPTLTPVSPHPPPSSPQSSASRDRLQQAALASPRGKPRNGMHAPSAGGGPSGGGASGGGASGGPWRGRGDQTAGGRKRKMTAPSLTSSSSSSSSPASPPGVDHLRKNGNAVVTGPRATPPPPPPPPPPSNPGWKRSLARGVGGAGSRREELSPREHGPSREHGPWGLNLLYRQGPGASNGPSSTSFSLKNDPGQDPPLHDRSH
ncbi:unnamed protein product [Arctogadus glacialis]